MGAVGVHLLVAAAPAGWPGLRDTWHAVADAGAPFLVMLGCYGVLTLAAPVSKASSAGRVALACCAWALLALVGTVGLGGHATLLPAGLFFVLLPLGLAIAVAPTEVLPWAVPMALLGALAVQVAVDPRAFEVSRAGAVDAAAAHAAAVHAAAVQARAFTASPKTAGKAAAVGTSDRRSAGRFDAASTVLVSTR